MKITVIGASQGIGLALLKIALEEGHEITALVRRLGKINITDPRLTVVQGNILDMALVNKVVAGQDVICVCIGIQPTRKPIRECIGYYPVGFRVASRSYHPKMSLIFW